MKAIRLSWEISVRAILVAIFLLNASVPASAKAAETGNRDADQTKTKLGEALSSSLLSAILSIPSSYPQPEITPPAEVLPDPVTLNLKASPETVEEDKKISLFWSILGVKPESLKGYTLSLLLPEGFAPVESKETELIFEKNTVTIPLTDLEGSLDLTASQIPTEDVFINATLLDADNQWLAFSDLILPFRKEFILTSQGGEIVTRDGALKVVFSRNTLQDYTKGIKVEIGTPADMEALQTSFSGTPFEIQATEKDSLVEVKQFDEPIGFQINLADYGITDAQSGGIHLYWFNPETGDWEGMLSWVDEETQTLHSETDHFSIFDIGVDNWEASKTPNLNAFQVASFTGAATYSLPIEVPPGPGGIQPSLSLNYNSQVVDEATFQSQPGWVGLGWSMDTGSIVRNTHNTTGIGDDTWSLSLDGISTEIIQVSPGVFAAADENYIKISFSNDVWTIQDGRGNTYYFEYVLNMRYTDTSACDLQTQPYQWRLTRVKNVHNQEMTYTYTKELKTVAYKSYNQQGFCTIPTTTTSDAASYLSTITYGGIRIRFELDDQREDYHAGYLNDEIHHSFERSRLKEVIVEGDTNGDQSFDTVMKKYVLTYSTDANQIWPNYVFSAGGKISTLVSIQEFGVGGVTALPATSFVYGDYMHLTHASNGYGGSISFEYDVWYDPLPRPTYKVGASNEAGFPAAPGEGVMPSGYGWLPLMPGRAIYLELDTNWPSFQVRLYHDVNSYQFSSYSQNPSGTFILPAEATQLAAKYHNNSDPEEGNKKIFDSKVWGLSTRYRVATKTVFDGNGISYPYTYNYYGPAMNNAFYSEAVSQGYGFGEARSEFRGHTWVTETAPDGTMIKTYFFQDDIYRGRAWKVETYRGGTLRSLRVNSYSATELAQFYYGGKAVKHYWVGLDTVENYIYNNSGGTASATQTLYGYDGYGNVILQTDQFDNGSGWVTYRIRQDFFFPNIGSNYLVSLPGKTKMFDGSGNVIGTTIYLYDGNTGDHQTMPINGKLTSVRTLMRTEGSEYSQVSYSYDGYGNQTGVTTWSGYGTWNANPNSGARTTTTTYDGIFHAYPVTTSMPEGLVTEWKYDFDKNGTNDYILGLPTAQIYPNIGITGNPAVEYDAFGRLIKLIRPGDSTGSPTIQIYYQDSFPFTTTIAQKVDATTRFAIQRVYDGIGRPVRVVDGDLTTTYYNGQATHYVLGGSTVDTVYTEDVNVTKQSMPYFYGETIYNTITTVIPAANTTTVTAPDGSSVTTLVNGLTTTVTQTVSDTEETTTTTLMDDWGRVILVTPPTGPSVSYAYDELDRLTDTTRGGATTHITYDAGGRKISMDDPDMGYWEYEYDALGNLVRQTDARDPNQTTCLLYDNLNRLTQKTFRTTTNCSVGMDGENSISYSYDQSANREGLRTGMIDPSGSTSWTYDERGRLTSETKVIDTQSFTTFWNYNSADLPTSMTYPVDGEVLTYLYNERMQLESVTSTLGDTYLTSADYDAAGRLTARTLDNDILQEYDYYGWDETVNSMGQGGRLKQLTTNSIQDLTYTYDEVGNILNIADAVGGENQAFAYDSLNRLISATVTNGPAPYNETYQYDPSSGNLIHNGSVTLEYNDEEGPAHAVMNAGENEYGYDGNGNMIFRLVNGVQTDLTYDEEGRLIGVESNGSPPPTNTPTPSFTFTPSPTNTPAAIFADVPYGHTYRTHIEAMYNEGITSGCSSNPLNFCPANSVTRGQMAVFMLRAKHGSSYTPPAVGSSTGFNDVPTNHPFAAWIKQFSEEGFTTGCGGGNFCPDTATTRSQASIFVLRAKYGSSYVPPEVGSSTGFNDVPTSHTFAKWIKQVAAEGASNGCGSGNFCPDSALTREQVAYFLATTFDWVAMNGSNHLAAEPEHGRARLAAWVPPVTPGFTPTPTLTLELSPTPTATDEGEEDTPTETETVPTETGTPSETSTPQPVSDTPTSTVSLAPTWTPSPTISLTPTLTLPSRSFDPVSEVFSSADFIYDGDGKRVKSVLTTNVGTTTTYFVGAHYEVTDGVVTKYYFAGASRIAMRKDGELFYLIGDHLGSTSIVTDDTGQVLSETRYKAWGEVRYNSGVTPTDYTYTGQYSDSYINLLDYGSRRYDPALGRFISPDTIIPDPSNSQAWDRYSYTFNNPIRYVDPDGHRPCDDEFDCSHMPFNNRMRMITPEEEKRGALMRYMNNEILNKNHELKKSLDPLDAMLMVIEKAASIYGDDWEGFLDVTTWIFTGYYGSGAEAMWEAHEIGDQFDGFFDGDADFHPDFVDDSNQVRHFWAAFSTAANPNGINPFGTIIANLGNGFHEITQDTMNRKDYASVMDYKLSVTGIDIAKQVGNSIKSPSELTSIFNTRLGISGPGYIGPYVDPLNWYTPWD